jgi:hypothetical protein
MEDILFQAVSKRTDSDSDSRGSRAGQILLRAIPIIVTFLIVGRNRNRTTSRNQNSWLIISYEYSTINDNDIIYQL